jgi:hypothetical protein
MGKIVGSILEPFTGAKATRAAANEAAAQQAEAAKKAGYSAAFRPVGMTTRFGTSRFTEEVDPYTGLPRVTSAGYDISPELKAIQDRIFGLTGGALTTAEEAQAAAAPLGQAATGLFGLGAGYLAESPQAARQRFFNQQQELLAQPRAAEEARLASSVFGRGRAGLNIGTTRRQQDLALAQQAEQAAQQQLGFGANLFGTGASLLGSQYGIPTQALGPLQTYLGTAGTLEEMGQEPYRLGMQLGGAVTQGGQAGGQLLGAGLSQAAQTRYQGVQQANAANAAFLQTLIGAAAGGGGKGFGGGGTGVSAASYGGQPWGGTPSNPWYG